MVNIESLAALTYNYSGGWNTEHTPIVALCLVFQWHSVLNKMAVILFGFLIQWGSEYRLFEYQKHLNTNFKTEQLEFRASKHLVFQCVWYSSPTVIQWGLEYRTQFKVTEPFKNQILKSLVFEWRSVFRVRFSSPHCSTW